jgi:hypothetical protein
MSRARDLGNNFDGSKAKVIDAAGDIIYGIGNDSASRLAIGTAGQVLQVNSGASAPEWENLPTSTITWTIRKNENEIFANDTISNATRGAAYLNGEYWVWGSGGKIARSTDAITWTTVSIGSTNLINKVFYSSSLSLYIAIFDGGVLRTSANGTSWTARTSTFTTSNINGIVEKAGVLVIVGDDGKGASSTTGTAWTSRTLNNSTNTFYNVAASANEFVAVASVGGVSRSTDGTSWTLISSILGNDIVYANTGFFVFYGDSSANSIRYSVDGTSGNWDFVNNFPCRPRGVKRNTFAIIDGNNFLTIGASDATSSPYVSNVITKVNTNVYGTVFERYLTATNFTLSPVSSVDNDAVYIVHNAGDLVVVGPNYGIYTSF